MKYIAFCPIEFTLHEALKLAGELKDNEVAIVNRNCDIRFKEFSSDNANRYGYDLYLYQIDSEGNKKFVSGGDFN